MDEKGWYNGYAWNERNAKLRAMKRLVASKELAPAKGPCQLCGDPDVPVEYHDEDYSKPYIWGPPALFALCRNCHRDKLHKRFAKPFAWKAFLAHVRRGDYASDLKQPSIKREVLEVERALALGDNSPVLPTLRPYAIVEGTEWFSIVSLDPIIISPAAQRPRP